jgi:glycosyltransferase involved in cell wall biosynthesis
MGLERIAVITPAYNEREHIDALVETILAQSLRPNRWVIVDDGSTDDTEARVKKRTAGIDWVEVCSSSSTNHRSFASKAAAVNRGAQRLSTLDFELLACVDADVVLPANYFAELASRFAFDPSLGVAGGTYQHPVGHRLAVDRPPSHHVPGPAQVFRREVFEQIGGYWPLRHGGIDTAANVAARMRGWTTRSFADLRFDHRRRMGTAGRGPVAAEYRQGMQDRDLGVLTIWALLRSLQRLARRPYIAGGAARWAGFVVASARRQPRLVDPDFVTFLRAEQRRRLVAAVRP